MNTLELLKQRHSVRNYLDKKIPEQLVKILKEKVAEVNQVSGLNFTVVTDEKKAFGGLLPKYGSFRNANNYIVCAGVPIVDLDEKIGYYGEELVLFLQEKGLNSCWVGLTFKKSEAKKYVAEDEKLCAVISFGYGATQGNPHKNKPVEKILGTGIPQKLPDWLKNGIMGAMLAPTAVNAQGFKISLTPEGKVEISSSRIGPYAKLDVGIVKYQFELAAGSKFPGFATAL